ncbi:MAG: adenylosuccinate lyase [Ignavibacteriales bacterium CG18_big_fil_WC_8_21_14_2_50_31_20]|nr:MAG: adenylosuccinate lyase [Ignavibacteriales bacterium CG18_big_fil_WC_8_21_14_2_50_31_20]
MDKITNVLAERYASEEMKNIWSPEGRILLERELWIAVMKAQKELGFNIPAEAIKSYESVKANINLESINARERISRHDVKARIEEFCELAGFEHIHKGMTSRDLTENVEQLQVFRGLYLLMGKGVAALSSIAEKAEKYSNLIIAARTHNVAAQPTTLGRRLAMFGEELLFGVNQLQFLIDNYPVRGLKGAVGTQVDQLTLFNNNSTKVKELEQKLLNHLGIKKSLNTVGQVYPRIIDFSVISTLFTLGSGLSSFATTLRIMAGNETVSEGFAKGQTGSSAMPHKMNSRSSERINGFQNILAGYVTMASSISGNQWNEGDVSCSVVRRVALPDSFYAIDGMLETFLTIIEQMEVFEPVIEKENKYYFPFLSTTTFLMEAVKKGTPREEAHEVIKEHSVETVRDLRNGIIVKNNLLERLANDARLGLSLTELQSIMDKSEKLIGNAKLQIIDFVEQVDVYKHNYPKAQNYKPGDIL